MCLMLENMCVLYCFEKKIYIFKVEMVLVLLGFDF